MKLPELVVDIENDFPSGTLLHIAVLLCDYVKMKEIMGKDKTSIHQKVTSSRWDDITFHYITPISIACYHGYYDAFQLLVEYGTDVTYHSNLICFIMYVVYTLSEMHIQILQKLIDLGVNVNVTNHICDKNLQYRKFPLMMCYKMDRFPCIDMFVKAGAVLTDETFLDIANSCVHVAIFKKMFEYGANPNASNKIGQTAFMVFIKHIYYRSLFTTEDTDIYEIAKLFVEYGATIHLRDERGQCILHYIQYSPLCYSTQQKLVQLLMKQITNVLVVDTKLDAFILQFGRETNLH